VPENLLEAEFFGVAPGAYTGAERKGRDGKFKLADGGTLFLDEIGDMPLALQSKLLRVLQERELEPLGSNQVQAVDVRVIAATSRDLQAMVADGHFRADLYYRLNVMPIRLPPLRERLDDLEALAEALVEDIARRSGLPARSLTPEAIEHLAGQPWPGNIRELRNTLEQAILMSDDLVLGLRHFPRRGGWGGLDAASTPAPPSPADSGLQGEPTPLRGADDTFCSQPLGLSASTTLERSRLRPLAEQVAEVERAAIAQALAATSGNRVAAARLLGMSRAALYDRLARWPGLIPAGGPGVGRTSTG
jgi:transcriptional regulator with PAS, ATPase and Fis domain